MMLELPRTPEEIAAEKARREQAAADRWPLVVGLAGTLVIHLFLIGTASQFRGGDDLAPDDVETLRQKYEKQELTFLLADEEPEPQPMRFVETNPDAPENDPGKTTNFGAQNQQAAQPEPGDDHNDRPKTEGELEESTAIVTGSREQPVESAPAPGANGQNGTGMEAVVVGMPGMVRSADPLPGFEKITGDNPEGIGTSLGKAPDGKAEVDEKKDGDAKESEETGDAQPMLAVNGGGMPGPPGRPSPRPRPKLPNVRSAVLANQPLSASNAGVIGVDAKFSEFGDYLQEFVDTVDAQWQKIVGNMRTYPPARSRVTVRFKLNSQGEISQILDVVGGDTTGRAGTYACLDAIRERAPYRPWTKEMVAVLGTEQEITFSFLYW